MNREPVIEQILRKYEANEPLNIAAIKRESPKLMKYAFSVEPFWGWYGAVTDAGVDYRTIKVELLDCLLCEICGKTFKNLANHVRLKHGYKFEDYKAEYPESSKLSEQLRAMQCDFENTDNVLIPHWEPLWSDEYALDRLAEFHRRGFMLNESFIQERDNPTCLQLIRRFGSLNNAFSHIGLNYNEHRLVAQRTDWDASMVIKQLQAHHQSGTNLAPGSLEKCDNHLYSAASRLFGGYANALEAAGVNPATVYLIGYKNDKPERQEFLETVKQFCLRKDSKICGEMVAFKAKYTGEISRWYNRCWGHACDDAQIPKTHPMRKPPQKYPDKAAVIQGIKARKHSGHSLRFSDVDSGKHPDPMLLKRSKELYGSWNKALISAGTKQGRVRRKYPTKTDVIAEIKRRQKLGMAVSYNELYEKAPRERALVKCGKEYFGSWRETLNAAGVKPCDPRRKYPDETSVLKAIKTRWKNSLSLIAEQVHRGEHRDPSLLRWGKKYFGSWDAALLAAGVNTKA